MILWSLTLALPQAEEITEPEPSASGESYSYNWEIVQEQHLTIAILNKYVFADQMFVKRWKQILILLTGLHLSGVINERGPKQDTQWGLKH